jgi:cell division protein FtsW
MLFIGGINVKNGICVFIALLLLGSAAIFSSPHRVERFTTFLQGDKVSLSSSNDENYHIEHAKLAIGTGGLFGVGIGNSVQATGYLPEAINDSVFAIMGETFGFVGLMIILSLFIALMMQLLRIMDHLPDMRLKLFIAGVFGWIASHVILNVASMIGVVPLTGITLPLLSLGGTSILFIGAALGVVFQLSQYTVHSSNLKEAKYENSSSRGRIRRSRYTRSSSSTRN